MLQKLLNYYRQTIWIRSVEKHKSCLTVPLAAKYTAFHRQCQKSYDPQSSDVDDLGSNNQEMQYLKSEFDDKDFVFSQTRSTEDLANSML